MSKQKSLIRYATEPVVVGKRKQSRVWHVLHRNSFVHTYCTRVVDIKRAVERAIPDQGEYKVCGRCTIALEKDLDDLERLFGDIDRSDWRARP